MAEARQGSRDRLGTLLELYRNYLHLLARTHIDLRLQGKLNPSDLVQETFVQAIGHFDQFRGQTEKEFLAWLRRILVNSLAHQVDRQFVAEKRDVRREVSLQRHLEAQDRSEGKLEAALGSTR
ncbi:MAG TPA: sigma factor, partial [Bryobacteraceae bacterium]|nr:sigma factor [Bryobacteraceae bacterium]